MIDWFVVLFNAIWVFGAAVLLATVSYASWQAAQLGDRWRECLSQPGYQQALLGGGMLLSLGFAGIVDQTWRQLLLFTMALICLGILGVMFLSARTRE